MALKSLFFMILLSGIFTVSSSSAGCLEPEVVLDQGSFNVESCAYHSTTNGVYKDPRLQSIKGVDIDKNPLLALQADKKKGEPKIFSLSEENRGVLLQGKLNNQTNNLTAFLRTKDRNYCEKFIKSKIAEVVIHEMCCDCMNSCTSSPCALGTKNEITKIIHKP
ncbi:hypothetical protein DOM22_12565 [Bdellovibrio sp. ZAP7]|uniref:hypothetical protein n=1 Tax=Bdellovibrio sp. ZAP7 TaxID=2231053 RepID=UPI001159B78C|nr:hypothetical protein [Bdellovibrio sp. ZAP7]QDK45924.1 hypothetical protein DOM22_12565 [Bdellovibrio sp. ZAP7]